MQTELTPGCYRGLKASGLAERDVFGILAFDQRGSYRKMMPPPAEYAHLVQVKREVSDALSAAASAVLLDPIYGLPAAMSMSGRAGLLLALEKSGYRGDSSYRQSELLPGWTAAKIRSAGANAVKLMVYYNPQRESLAAETERFIVEVVHDCHRLDLPVFLEPMSYSARGDVSKNSPEFARERPEIVIETARRLSQTGADVLKLEFPVDIEYDGDWRTACLRLSQACAVPWVLLSAGVDFEQFKPQLQIACECGASGFLAGRAIWKEAVGMSTAARAAFLRDTALERLRQLLDIAERDARPWTDFYQAQDFSERWFESYPPTD